MPRWRASPRLGCDDENYRQLAVRHASLFARQILKSFRADELTAVEAAAELGISQRHFYRLWRSYLLAVAQR
jgi:DNA-directed RNA polymerase specialized sigma subunit